MQVSTPETSFTKVVDDLLTIGVGDIARLNIIKKRIDENKVMYNSDVKYVRGLEQKHLIEKPQEPKHEEKRIMCWNCSKENLPDSLYCAYCRTTFEQKISINDINKFDGEFISELLSNIKLYQVLAVLGGLAVLIPVAYGIYNIENVLSSLDFYLGYDLTNYTNLIIASGVLAGLIAVFDMVIPFVWEKPEKIGKVLLFSSFLVLLFSLVSGVIGFIILLVSGIITLRKY